MAFGFTPKYNQDLPLDDLTSAQFLVAATETTKRLKWEIGFLSENGLIAYTKNKIFSWNAEFKIVIEKGIAKLTSSSTGSEMMDWGKNKKNIEKFIFGFNKIKSSLSLEDYSIKFDELKVNFVPINEDILIQPPQTTTQKITGIFSIFIPTEGFIITPILIDFNILIFIIMGFSGVNILQPDIESLLKWGANFRPSTLDGEWWRLMTNCFLHIGIFHLLMNMYALLYIGLLLEPHLGKTRFLTAYLLTGLTASITSLIIHSLTVSAGASGAIFGLYGVFLAMLTTNLIEKTTRKALFTSIAVFVGYNLLYGLKGGIDNAAHIGGLIGGLIIGYAFIPSLKEPDEHELRYKAIIYLSVIIISISVIVYDRMPNDFKKYDEKIKQFPVFESMAIEVLKGPTITLDQNGKVIPYTKEKTLSDLKDRGIYYWNECIKLLNDIDKLRLPEQIKERNKKLTEYCQIRIKSFELMYKAVKDDSPMYQIQIDNYNKQIEQIIKDLTPAK